MGDIGRNMGQAYQNRQTLPWARPGFQGAPQGAAMGWNRQPQGVPFTGAMPASSQGQGMPFNRMPDMWTMLQQGRFSR